MEIIKIIKKLIISWQQSQLSDSKEKKGRQNVIKIAEDSIRE
jgi:hypothetical protein